MYKWQQVKTLKAQGVSIKGITKQLKLSKNTVRKYLRSSEPPRFKARQYERLLEQYEETVEGMLEKHYIGTRTILFGINIANSKIECQSKT
jgi:transposase